MAHESFENAAVADLLNADFVPIKVDREERPDVDKIYMSYVQALTGHGGWPLSAWLTPELKPFYGGTYFPPEDRHGRSGFPSILRAIALGWRNEREKLTAEAERVLAALQNQSRAEAARPKPGPRRPTRAALSARNWPRARPLHSRNASNRLPRALTRNGADSAAPQNSPAPETSISCFAAPRCRAWGGIQAATPST